MAAKKTRKREYIPPSHEVVNRRERSTTTRTHKSTSQRPTRGAATSGAAREYPVPSLRRTLKRLPLYFVLIFALQYFFSGQDGRGLDTQQRILFAAGSAAFVTLLFAPFMHMMDRVAYNRFLKRGGQPAAPSSKS